MSNPNLDIPTVYRNSGSPVPSPVDVADCCPTCGGPKIVSRLSLPDGTSVRSVSCPVCQHADADHDLHNLARVSPSEGMQSESGWQVYLFLIFVLLCGLAIFTILLPWLEGGR